MIRSMPRRLLLSALLLALMVVPVQKADAGLVPDIWNAIFGPPGTPYFGQTTYFGQTPNYAQTANYGRTTFDSPGYYPRYRVGYSPGYFSGFFRGYSVGYAPVSYGFVGNRGNYGSRRVYYVPACCSPCATTAPGQTSSASGKLTPRKENPNSRTFRKQTGEGTQSGEGTKSGEGAKPENNAPSKPNDSKFKSRSSEKKFQPTRDEAKKSPFPGANGEEGGETPSGQRRTFKNPEKTPPLTIIPKKKPARPKPPKEDGKAAPKENKSNGPRIQGLKLDAKITWRTVPTRNRLIISMHITQPKLARTRTNPNRGWRAVREGTRLVRK